MGVDVGSLIASLWYSAQTWPIPPLPSPPLPDYHYRVNSIYCYNRISQASCSDKYRRFCLFVRKEVVCFKFDVQKTYEVSLKVSLEEKTSKRDKIKMIDKRFTK